MAHSAFLAHPASTKPECIRLRGVRQNNLKGFDLDLPLGKYVVVTGLSGAGKSSLVFDTLHAEGQRRYVETFSAYTRQFLDLLDKPKVDAIENIRPSIAIEQTNTVKTSRSTVGTMTELTDFFKNWFSHVATCFDPATGKPVEDDTPATIWQKTHASSPDAAVIVAFRVTKPEKLTWHEILTHLKGQSYVRVLTPTLDGHLAVARIDDLLANPKALDAQLAPDAALFVAQDRVTVNAENRARFLEATEQALHFGQGQVYVFSAELTAPSSQLLAPSSKLPAPSSQLLTPSPLGHYSRGLHSPETGRTFRAASPALFSFNSPLGACPQCKGFGRIIEIDYRLAIPDATLSIDDGAIKCWEGEVYGASKDDLKSIAKRKKIPTNVPFGSLTPEQRDFVINGEPGYGENDLEWPRAWYGVKGFFRWLEKSTYKMHVRVFLSRYRSYNLCPSCHGTRLQPESLCWRWQGKTLPELYQTPVAELLAALRAFEISNLKTQMVGAADHASAADLALDSIRTRLSYLQQVGLGYLTLDRSSKTLSGGEVQRVNLTSCLGTSLVDTLFVLDEPSVGLHPRDIERLIAIIRTLTDAGNTVVVVEHDEAMIRAADHLIEVGPEPGTRGGHIVFQGELPELLRSEASITGRYLSGRDSIAAPSARRPVDAHTPRLSFTDASKHNLRNVTLHLPLHRLVALSGVSGSGKSTLLDNVIHQGLLAKRLQLTDDPAVIAAITGDELFDEIVLVDQSPLSRTPRSNPALYTEAWELIRDLYAKEPAAKAAGFNSSSFSFNSGEGRCDHCQGLGYERVEMQFLSDVFVPCPICESRRFKPEVLAIQWQGLSVAELLATSVTDALPLFAGHAPIRSRLASLESVGLGYLTLGQPLNMLSGGESQRLKLVKYLAGFAGAGTELKAPSSPLKGALLLLDEPTTGLHRHDVKRLIAVLQALVDRGHSVVVIEHNLDVLKSADWLIEVGPEAGVDGGQIIAEGPPDELAHAETATAPFLRDALGPQSSSSASPLPAPSSKLPAPSSKLLDPSSHQLVLTGARENNLKNLSLAIAHRQLTVVTGVSGSGKSTLAFDIVFAEGQRRFMESMSPYARQFVEQLPRPAIDRLTGIPPTVAIEQRITRGSRKSTVATITEVAQYLRLLYARLGVQHHPDTGKAVQPLTPGQLKKLLATVLASPKATKAKHLYLCAPLIRGRKGHHQPIATWIADHGYELMRADGRLLRVDTFTKLDRYSEHDIEVVVADLKQTSDGRNQTSERGKQKSDSRASEKKTLTADIRPLTSSEALERALQLGKGSCFIALPTGDILSWFSTTRTDIETGESFPELDPKQFSHNSPRGWCPTCRGHGRVFPWMLEPVEDNEDDPAARLREFGIESGDDLSDTGTPCPDCHGQRLNRVARAVRLHLEPKNLNARNLKPEKKSRSSASALQVSGLSPQVSSVSLPELLASTPAQLIAHLGALQLDERGRLITQDIVPQIQERLKFLDHVGLGYLAMDRPTDTLSGGEAQRIRLAAQLGTNLAGVLYVLDEPSIGLHARDNDRLIETLLTLRDKGNTLLVVEHDDELMERADCIIDLGPAAGRHGGELLAQGTPAEIKASAKSLTGLFLAKGITHPLRGSYRPVPAPKSQKPRRA